MTYSYNSTSKVETWTQDKNKDGVDAASFVGGVEPGGKYAAAAMDFDAYSWTSAESKAEVAQIQTTSKPDANAENNKKKQVLTSDLTAKKSYFLFDDEIVCVGSDIDFTNTEADRQRYNTELYGYQNFDLAASWTKNGNLNTPVINTTNGTLTATTANTSTWHIIKTGGNIAPLNYAPGTNDYLQLRLKVDNAVSVGNDTIRVGAYYGVDGSEPTTATTVTYRDLKLSEHLNKGYFVVTIPMTQSAYLQADRITALQPFINTVTGTSAKAATFTFDYVFVGPKEWLPSQDHLYFNFTNGLSDKIRYSASSYGKTNFDQAANWWYNTVNATAPTISGGSLIFSPSAACTNSYHYLHSGRSKMMPLQYVPGAKDYCQVNIKIENAVSTASNGMGRFVLYYGINEEAVANSNYDYIDFTLTGRVDSHYFVLTFPLDNSIYTGANMINAIRTQFSNLKSADGKTAKFLIDYLYIGPKESLPLPLYTVTFKDADGKTLATQEVQKGSVATYTGATPTKGCDASHHYSFKGWDQALTNITADTTLTAQFAATAHSYSYANADAENHIASCACGYSKKEAHSFLDGACVCGEAESLDPVMNEAFKIYHSLNLASDISVNYAVPIALLEGYDMETVYLEVETDEYDGNTLSGTTTVKLTPVEEGSYYYFTLTGLSAVRMNNELRAVLYGQKGTQPYYSATDVYSIASYAYSHLYKISITLQIPHYRSA